MITSQETVPLSPSSRLVLRVLYEVKITDMKTLQEETRLPKRTLMYAISQLRKAGMVRTQFCLNDSRKRYYCISVNGI
ncbi:MAG: MarR family winged helix-turn-helix transcriptional regulator [Candidatus Thermoplasmatota archaeon]|jgi:DNA-binding MarR family transcriptional regulator|nr:MarR family winged helix-turn-helix transcriptional regulator [Candidatus Thermoplasmatota archaeon]